MAKQVSVNVRMFQVGELGDCFHLCFKEEGKESNVLIDCGSFRNSEKSKTRLQSIVSFLNKDLGDKKFDVVITPFLFDNFTEQTTQKVFSHINQLLKRNGTWLNVDFQLTGKWWQNILLKSMFLFCYGGGWKPHTELCHR